MAAKSLDTQNVLGGGGGNRHQYKLRYLAKIVLSLIHSYSDVWSVVLNKQSDFYFDKNSFKFILYRFYTE